MYVLHYLQGMTADARATVVEVHFFSEVPQFGSVRLLPKTDSDKRKNCYRMKNPMV